MEFTLQFPHDKANSFGIAHGPEILCLSGISEAAVISVSKTTGEISRLVLDPCKKKRSDKARLSRLVLQRFPNNNLAHQVRLDAFFNIA